MAHRSEKWLADYRSKRGAVAAAPPPPSRASAAAPPSGRPQPKKFFALGRLPIGKMNKTEAAYDAHLETLHHTGEVLWHKFEGIKLRLADNTFLTIDFAVLPSTRVLEMHEVKGFWQEDARVKIKVAASLYPFRFVAVKVRAKKDGGGWAREDFGEDSGESREKAPTLFDPHGPRAANRLPES